MFIQSDVTDQYMLDENNNKQVNSSDSAIRPLCYTISRLTPPDHVTSSLWQNQVFIGVIYR